MYDLEEVDKYLSIEEKIFLTIIGVKNKCNFNDFINNKYFDYYQNSYRKAIIITAEEIVKYDNFNLSFYKITDEMINLFNCLLNKNYKNILKSKVMKYGYKLSDEKIFNLINYKEIFENEIKIIKNLNELPEVKFMDYVIKNDINEIKTKELVNIINKNDISFLIGKLKRDNKIKLDKGKIIIINKDLYGYNKLLNSKNNKIINELKNRGCIEIKNKLIDVELSLTERGIEFYNEYLIKYNLNKVVI